MRKVSQRGNRKVFDVIVVGSGSAGLSYCLELSALQPQAKIALISKVELCESNSMYAQGGISAVSLEQDSFAAHAQDTSRSGGEIGFKSVVDHFVASAPAVIEFLEIAGVRFDRQGDVNALAKEGGHSERRVHHVADYTGAAVVGALLAKVRECENITVFENHMAVNLITNEPKHQPGNHAEIVGAYILDENTSLIHTFLSKVFVLATGGAGKVYRYTSNPAVATGDGVAMAYRAGARVNNMAFYQFHPTVLYHDKMNNFLISEAVRGEGAKLVLKNGERFMQRYAPEQMELATRDVVARAIFNEIEKGEDKCVYLDIRHQPKEFLQKHFEKIYQTLLELGIDMSTDLIPVVPAAHYQCGGVLTDINGMSDLKRLFVIGETANTGLHGANRLASNSLMECVAMGRDAAKQSCDWLQAEVTFHQEIGDWDSLSVVDTRRASQISAHWRGLRGEMTSYAGIVRTEAGLKDLLRLLQVRREMIEEYYWNYTLTRDLIELRNIALIAELIVQDALHRKESVGCHYREDT